MTRLDAWMPAFDIAATYRIRIATSPERVYAALLAADVRRPWLVRALMGVRLLPSWLRSPGAAWRQLRSQGRQPRSWLANLEHSDFVLLDQVPPQEVVLGITGRFWTLRADIVRIEAEQFRAPLAAGLAQAAWNFAVTAAPGGTELTTETRVRCADAATRRRFRWYWRVVAPGSGFIRRAILHQVRREAMAAGPALPDGNGPQGRR